MKLLVLDVGNTSTAVGDWTNGRIRAVAHIDGDAGAVNEELIRRVVRTGRYAAVAYASVVPPKDRAHLAILKSLGLHVICVNDRTFAAYGEGAGLRLDYPKPAEIGADRFADAAGAFARYGAPTLIMDFGTALTAAIITGDGVWRGGVIAPGFPLMRDYLFERTAKLPRMELGGRTPRIGRSTEEAMRFGAIVGYRGMVREIVGELERNFGESFRLVATGGYARWALRGSGLDFTIDPTLTLYGTGLICAHSLSGSSAR